ncbi:MAG: phosphoribosyltransferase [Clostridia bacterium]|nr:phosphoribosyltransferase [Clostridia bacterium]
MEREVLTWADVEALVDRLVQQLPNPREFDALLAITRGGMIPAALISEITDIRNIMVAAVMFYQGPWQGERRPYFLQFPENELLQGKRVLVVDDVWGNGRIAMSVKVRAIAAGARPEVAVLHFRPAENEYPNERPEYVAAETNRWIVYPWDRDR